MSEFETLRKAFKGDLVTPSDAEYPTAISRWAINARRQAKVVAFVKDAKDVSAAVLYAKANKLPIAIRGGGHSASGASSSEGGLVVDLSRYLNGVTVDAEKKLGYIGGGSLWGTVDKTAIQYGLATVGGTVNHTGVGGLLLGGGYGWLSGQHGLALDNLVQATVVTADGSILTANETTNPDLFFGIRGGGSNFGVCTEFIMKLHSQRRTIFAGHIIFPPQVLKKLVSATQEWWAKGPAGNEAMIQVYTRAPDGKPCIACLLFYNGSEDDGRKNFKWIYDLNPVVDMAKEVPYEVLNSLQNEGVEHDKAVYMKGVAQLEPSLSTIEAAFDQGNQLSESGVFHINIFYEYFSLAKINSVPNGTTAFRRSPASNVLLLTNWKEDTPENFKIVQTSVWKLAEIFEKAQSGLKEADKVGYGNYNDGESGGPPVETNEVITEDKALGLFGDNYPKMKEIKKKYDPENVFAKWFAVTPAA